MFKITEERKRFLTIFIVSLLIYSTIAYVSTTPRPKEQFFQLYILGETKMAEKYYPNDNSTIPLDTPVKWFLGVTNFMDSIQYVAIKVKLSNSTLASPDETQAEPAPIPTLFEFHKVLSNNETWEFPFTWSIKEIQLAGEVVYIIRLAINDETITVTEIGAKDGHNYRLIFELWSFDINEGRFIFGWYASQERRCAWLQLWFNATKVAS